MTRFGFTPVPPWIVDGRVRWNCRNSHEDWREKLGDDSKNDSPTWAKRKQSTWFPRCERKPVQEVFMILLTFQLRIVWQFVWRSHRQKQTIWSQQWKQGDDRKLMFIQTSGHSWSITPSGLHGAEHSCTQGRNMFLPERCTDSCVTSFTRRTIPCDVCENFHVLWESRCHENNVCTRRPTQIFIREDDDIGHAHECE